MREHERYKGGYEYLDERARSRAASFSGIHAGTRVSMREHERYKGGYECEPMFSYGESDLRFAPCSASRGSPHSANSCTVSGSVGSSIPVSASTKGTSSTAAARS